MNTVDSVNKPRIHRLNQNCPQCGKVAKVINEWTAVNKKGEEHKYEMYECFHVEQKQLFHQVDYSSIYSFEGDDACNHDWDKNTCTLCSKHRLFPFQAIGCQFVEDSNGRAGIFDEQGLGKTVQSLVWLRTRKDAFPALFVVKSALQYQWYMSILTWLGDSYIPQVLKTGKGGVMPGVKCYIVSYDLLRRFDTAKIKQLDIRTLVLDEVQAIKNPDSARTTEVRDIAREIPFIIELSGTPWKNRGSEFFVALNLLAPAKFFSYQNFLNRWVDYFTDKNGKYKEGGIRNIPEFKEYIRDIVIRRERFDVMPELPGKNRVRFHCEIDDTSRKAYEDTVSSFVKRWNEAIISGEDPSFFNPANNDGSGSMIGDLMRMRHILGMAKLPTTIDRAIEFIEETDRKLIIGVHHIDVAQLMLKQLKKADLCEVIAMPGNVSAMERYEIQKKFNETKQIIMIASTLAAGEGLNLQTCNDMFIHERQWNPANEEQLEDRICRIGQEAQFLNITYIHADNSLDTMFDALVERKRVQYHNAMNEGAALQWNEQSLMHELGEMLVNDFNSSNLRLVKGNRK